MTAVMIEREGEGEDGNKIMKKLLIITGKGKKTLEAKKFEMR